MMFVTAAPLHGLNDTIHSWYMYILTPSMPDLIILQLLLVSPDSRIAIYITVAEVSRKLMYFTSC